MEQPDKHSVSEETFDDFLASENMLAVCEGDAIKEMVFDYPSVELPTLRRAAAVRRTLRVELG